MIVEQSNIPTDMVGQEIQLGPVLELDVDKLAEDYYDDPKTLIQKVQEYYTQGQFETPLSIVLTQREDGMWVVFEGTCNLKTHKFKVSKHITDFPMNKDNPRRPPTVAVNFICGLSMSVGLPIWIP